LFYEQCNYEGMSYLQSLDLQEVWKAVQNAMR